MVAESVGISFCLALVAVYSIRDFMFVNAEGSRIDEDEFVPSWVIWMLNPAVVTVCSYGLSTSLRDWLELCSVATNNLDPLTFWSALSTASAGLVATTKRAMSSLQEEPFFYVALGMWLLQELHNSYYCFSPSRIKNPVAFDCWVVFGESLTPVWRILDPHSYSPTRCYSLASS